MFHKHLLYLEFYTLLLANFLTLVHLRNKVLKHHFWDINGNEVKLEDTHIIALIAYLQRVGVDLYATEDDSEKNPEADEENNTVTIEQTKNREQVARDD